MATSSIKINVEDIGPKFLAAVLTLSLPVAQAAKATMVDAGAILKTRARSMIKGAGFGTKWQNAYRVNVFPGGGKISIDAAAFGRFKSISYSDIFATGGKIVGSPLLWIPFSSTPKVDRRKAHATPKDFIRKGVKLFTMNTGGAHPLLGASVKMSASLARGSRKIKVTLADLQAGAKKTKSKNVVTRSVPLFFGIPEITIKRRFNWDRVTSDVQQKVPELYVGNLNRILGQ